MIREIAEGRFFPDNSRSSYFPSLPKPKPAGGSSAAVEGSGKPAEVKVEVVSSDESDQGPGGLVGERFF